MMIIITSSGCDVHILDPIFLLGQFSANQMSAIDECLLFSGHLLCVLSSTDKNKHGTRPLVI